MSLIESRRRQEAKRREQRRLERLEWLRQHPRCMICGNPLRQKRYLTCSRPCAVKRWNWFKRKPKTRLIKGRTCPRCLGPIAPDKRPDTIYCSTRCAALRPPIPGRQCWWCGTEIDARRRLGTKFCDSICRDRYRYHGPKTQEVMAA